MEKKKNQINEVEEIDTSKFDWSTAKKNPFEKLYKRQITINLDYDVLEYFKKKSKQSRIPYQTLINSYLYDCAINDKLKIPFLEENED